MLDLVGGSFHLVPSCYGPVLLKAYLGHIRPISTVSASSTPFMALGGITIDQNRKISFGFDPLLKSHYRLCFVTGCGTDFFIRNQSPCIFEMYHHCIVNQF